MPGRIVSLSIRDLPGLPDVDLDLQPVTALIGPRASGKSRLLAAISWLMTGRPTLAGAAGDAEGGPQVTGLIETPAGRTVVSRGRGHDRLPALPPTTFLTARDRLPAPPPTDEGAGPSDASHAESMVADIAERRMAGAEGELLLIEEPELMLTPHQQRHFYGLLRRYAERNQVIYSTRSPALVDAVHHDEIVRLDLTTSGVAVRRAPIETLDDEQRLRLAAQFDHERNEMFFATAVVLVEGQTERLSLPPLFRRLGHDPDALGISIVEVGGKSNLILAARVLARLRIPYVIVHDSDRGRPAARENALIRTSAQGAAIFALDPDFEAAAGIRGDDDKILVAWRRFSTIAANRIPRVFRELIETTVALATAPPTR